MVILVQFKYNVDRSPKGNEAKESWRRKNDDHERKVNASAWMGETERAWENGRKTSHREEKIN